MQDKTNKTEEKPEVKTPDEKSGVLTQGKIKIFDPDTTEVFVEIRA
jgi:hypothetical protein